MKLRSLLDRLALTRPSSRAQALPARSARRALLSACIGLVVLVATGCNDRSSAQFDQNGARPQDVLSGDARSQLPTRRVTPLLGPMATHESAADSPNAGNVTDEFRAERHRLEALVEENRADTVSLLALARLLHDAHMDADAIPYYQAYANNHPNNRQVWLDLANVQASTGDWSGALASTEAVLMLYPDDPFALYNLGAIRANTGDRAGAEEAWSRVVAQRQNPGLAAQAASSIKRLGSPPQ